MCVIAVQAISLALGSTLGVSRVRIGIAKPTTLECRGAAVRLAEALPVCPLIGAPAVQAVVSALGSTLDIHRVPVAVAKARALERRCAAVRIGESPSPLPASGALAVQAISHALGSAPRRYVRIAMDIARAVVCLGDRSFGYFSNDRLQSGTIDRSTECIPAHRPKP
ncbi:hypothetical protein BC828DRAFT_394684 [Blastocladiella britannica]|nr:hypothetical protein BC828DRAFT_394684 [Blastocladiella britannica]